MAQPGSPRRQTLLWAYGALLGVFLLMAVGLLVWGPRLLAGGLGNPLYFFALVPLALGAAGFLYGALGAAYATAASFAVGAWLCLTWGNQRVESHRRAALVPCAIVAAALLAVGGQGLGIRTAGLTGAAAILLFWARMSRSFSVEDLTLLEQVECPRWVAALLTKVYTVLSSPKLGLEAIPSKRTSSA